MAAMGAAMPSSTSSTWERSPAYACDFGIARRSRVVSAMHAEPVEVREEDAVEDEQGQPLRHDAEPGADEGEAAAGEEPAGEGEGEPHGDIPDVEADVQPEDALEGQRGVEVAEVESAPGGGDEDEVDNAPRGALDGEVPQEWRAGAAMGEDADEGEADDDARCRPDEEAEEVGAFGGEEGVGPHGRRGRQGWWYANGQGHGGVRV